MCDPEEASNAIEHFLESDVITDIVKVWHLFMIVVALILIAIIVVCCIMRCRIPRTKQEIQADAVRTKITKQFRAHLNRIPIEGMELIKVLNQVKQYEEERIRSGTVDVNKTFLQKLKCLFKSEKDKPLILEDKAEELSGSEIDIDYLKHDFVNKQVSIELEEVLSDGAIVKTNVNQIKSPHLDRQNKFTKEESSEIIEKGRRTFKGIVKDEINKERVRKSWTSLRHTRNTVDQVDEDIFTEDDDKLINMDEQKMETIQKKLVNGEEFDINNRVIEVNNEMEKEVKEEKEIKPKNEKKKEEKKYEKETKKLEKKKSEEKKRQKEDKKSKKAEEKKQRNHCQKVKNNKY